MTEQIRRTAAQTLRSMLDGGQLRKNAIEAVCRQFRIGRSTLYGYCKRFGISTR